MNTEDELQSLFEAERETQPPSAAVDQGWQRLTLGLAANVAPLAVASGPIKLGWGLVPKWLFAGFAVGLGGVGVSATLLAPDAVATRPVATVVAPSVTVHAPLAVASAVVEPIAPVIAPSVPSPARSILAAGPAASMPATPTFDAELKLITFAKSELDAHHPARARAWLAEHAERFPNGVFATERDALIVLAACEQGPHDPTLARAFAARHPGSPLLARLESACQSNVPTKSSNEPSGVGEPMAEPNVGEQK